MQMRDGLEKYGDSGIIKNIKLIQKRENKELTKQEIEYFVKGYVEGDVADYQAAALVMAIFLNGMTKQETTDLTIAMANSGEILDLSKLNKIIVDKHSTDLKSVV